MRKFYFLLLTVFFFAIANAMDRGKKTIGTYSLSINTEFKIINEVPSVLNNFSSAQVKKTHYKTITTNDDLMDFRVRISNTRVVFENGRIRVKSDGSHAQKINLFLINTLLCGDKTK